ncbi:MAG: DUF21 domain-containing protein [Gammaproteobacteria bacterium]|nr:DUF21 domain-containing protein [Gammaproteobacteria bacterium]
MLLLIFYLCLALFVSFLCSILEAVFLSVTPTYIGSLDDSARHKKVLLQLKGDVDNAISSILILNTIAHTMGAAGVGAEAVRIFGVEWQSAIAVVLTLLILYFSEIIPKTIGATYWRELAKPSSHIIAFLTKILAPLLWISEQITKRIQKKGHDGPTREEISAMAAIGEQSGILEEHESELIENLITLKEVSVGDILTPRSVVFRLDADTNIESAMHEDSVFIYSRIPVYEDNRESIIGMVLAKHIMKAASSEEHMEDPIRSITTPIHRVPMKMPVYYLLDLFIQRKEHLFMVHDEYRQFSGIVTMEDAIETLLGREIMDEVDQVADMQQLAREKAARWKKQLEEKVRSGSTD